MTRAQSPFRSVAGLFGTGAIPATANGLRKNCDENVVTVLTSREDGAASTAKLAIWACRVLSRTYLINYLLLVFGSSFLDESAA